ncbi:MAG: hypothetical protein V7K56_35095 [Nostoc sp.]
MAIALEQNFANVFYTISDKPKKARALKSTSRRPAKELCSDR